MIIVIAGSITAFVILLLLPLISSTLNLRKKSPDALLNVRQNMVRNPRYFGTSFAAMMQKALHSYDGSGKIKLSALNDIIEAEKQELPEICDAIVYAKEDFILRKNVTFNKEIYCEKNAIIANSPEIRALYAAGSVTIGSNTSIVRWLDAEDTVVICDHCDMGMSVTCNSSLIMGADITFRRLYAPSIHLGADLTNRDVTAVDGLPRDTQSAGMVFAYKTPTHRNVHYVNEALTDDNSREIEGTVISKHEVEVMENITLMGHIRSHKSVTIHDNACVHGNIFAEGDIHIGQGAHVYGNVFTQENLSIDGDAQIGQYGEIKSVIARGDIIINAGCRIYGYVSSERRGLCCPDPDKFLEYLENEKSAKAATPEEFIKPAVLPVTQYAEFNNAAEFDRLSSQVFRKNRHLLSIIIPEGVTHIKRSFFYECHCLKSVTLPSTLEHIDDYAFYGCVALKKINLQGCPKLSRIGEHAFEGCVGLDAVQLPNSITEMGNAAFFGCENIEVFSFGNAPVITCIPEHALFGCKALKSIILPAGLKSICTSAFYGCKSLTELSIPAGVEKIGGYAFYECFLLTRIIIKSTQLEPDENMLEGLDEYVKVEATNTDTLKMLRRRFDFNIDRAIDSDSGC